MSVENGISGPDMDFVLAIHFDEFAEGVATALRGEAEVPDVVALEMGHIARSMVDLDLVLPVALRQLKEITDPKTPQQKALGHLSDFGSFHATLMRPFVGTGAKIVLVDVYEDPVLGNQSNDFNSYEQPQRLAAAIGPNGGSLAERKMEIVRIARKAGGFVGRREAVVLDQLHDLADEGGVIRTFLGMAHQAVTDQFIAEGYNVTKTFVPRFKPWSKTTREVDDYSIGFYNLMRSMMGKGQAFAPDDRLVEQVLLAEFIVEQIDHNPALLKAVGGVAGAPIAANRIAAGLSDDKIRSKLKALEKSLKTGQGIAKVIKPLLPKHDLETIDRRSC